jgi:diadenosine tetraphosphatase ApaH/serine/threonine PP2A family protein phosphatase
VLSDIHGNRQALDATMRAMRGAGVTTWWCLGDLVGYGADPGHCTQVATSSAERCLAGNHDLAASGRVPSTVFVDWAYDAIRWTQAALGPSDMEALRRLMPSEPDHEVPIYHASPRDPVWEYVLTDEVARASLERVRAPLTLIGHTHRPSAWRLTPEGDLEGGFVRGEQTIALTEGRWLANPGSVGQPRDGDARAAWMVYDPDEGTLDFRRTPYDVAAAQNAILAAGLPAMLADRLSLGR